MIKIANLDYLEKIKKAQLNVGVYSNYLIDVIEPAIYQGDWDKFEALDIGFDTNGKSLGKIGDNEAWKSLQPFFEPDARDNHTLDFSLSGEVIERNLRNELKTLILKMMWLSPKDHSFATMASTIVGLKKLINPLLSEGINSFSYINYGLLEKWILEDSTEINFRRGDVYVTLNKLFIEKVGLPFEVSLTNILSASDFNLTLVDAQQYTVVPQRLYHKALCESESLVNNLYANRDEIARLLNYLVNFRDNLYKGYAKQAAQGLRVRRNGKVMWNLGRFEVDAIKADAFQKEFSSMDSPTEEQIFELLNKHRPTIRDSFFDKCYPDRYITICGESISSFSEAEQLLTHFSGGCIWAILARSGIRIDELYDLHTVNGCEKETISGQDIYIIHADLDKTVKGNQSKQDEFVTTEISQKAYEVLQVIHRPLRDMNNSTRFFHSFRGKFDSSQKKLTGRQAQKWFNKTLESEIALTEDDIRDLKISDPEQSFKVGEKYHFTSHQLRRSFAYYLIGFELLSFPQLKQQFSHVSLAMSRHYAKNASKFQKIRTTNRKEKHLYTEINDERVRQKAQIYLNIYKKLANKERIAGGKGKAFAETMMKKGRLAFKDKVDNDMLTLAYWKRAIRDGRHHIHAVAPSIYCTSRNCDLRTQVNLMECVDCNNDYIVDAVYAEAARKEAEINMHYDIENNELTPQTASESYIKITAAQRIMDDLGIDYEPVEFPPQVNELLIPHIGA